MNRLRKVDTVALAEVLGVAVNPDWRAAEIREVVKDALFPAGAEDDRRDLRNLGAKKKEERPSVENQQPVKSRLRP